MKTGKAIKGGLLYTILLTGTAIIVAVMFIIDRKLEVGITGNKNGSTNKVVFMESDADINELLLSGGDLTIEEKTSLINLYLKNGEPVAVKNFSTIKEGRDLVYKEILKRQINKSKNKPTSDFSVRPIPQ